MDVWLIKSLVKIILFLDKYKWEKKYIYISMFKNLKLKSCKKNKNKNLFKFLYINHVI